ncbi:MAG: FkbM family methyltransferase [Bdellovibrionales bacterium]|nr:FkbM family methyltransferase [Bdellovibrionales bacterium]
MSKVRKLGYCLLTLPLVNPLLRFIAQRSRGMIPPRILQFLPYRGIVELHLPGIAAVRLKASYNDWMATQFYWFGIDAHEPETVSFWLCAVENAEVIIDIGANIGIYSILAAQKTPHAHIAAFEPVPQVRKALEENLKQNSIQNVTTEPYALGDREGTIDLHIPDGIMLPISSSITASFRSQTRPYPVPITSLDSYVERKGWTRVDLVKIDAEGADLMVLRGGRNTIRRFRPTLIIEVMATTFSAVNRELLELGYSLQLILPGGKLKSLGPQLPDDWVWGNVLATPQTPSELTDSASTS